MKLLPYGLCYYVLRSWHDADVSVQCVGYGLKGVEAYAVLSCLYAADVVALLTRLVGDVLLRHALLCAQRGNVIAYALPLLFVLDHDG